MATPAKVETREEKMDLISCLSIKGEYDIKTGVCRYKVKINLNGEEEYVVKDKEGD